MSHCDSSFDPATHLRLLQQADAAGSSAQAWLLLEAAHVLGQLHLRPHWQTHVRMLALAWRSADGSETMGQLLRLALVPLGHLSRRLPAGNPGRATVSAFTPLPVRPEIAQLIARARRQ